MAFVPNILEQGFLELTTRPPASPQEYAARFAAFYDQFALTATPPPVTAGRRTLLEQALAGPSANPKGGGILKGIAAINQGLSAFWVGVVIPGGSVTAYLGAPALAALSSSLGTKVPAPQAARNLAFAHLAASRLVQYLIPPGPPAFLV